MQLLFITQILHFPFLNLIEVPQISASMQFLSQLIFHFLCEMLRKIHAPSSILTLLLQWSLRIWFDRAESILAISWTCSKFSLWFG